MESAIVSSFPPFVPVPGKEEKTGMMRAGRKRHGNDRLGVYVCGPGVHDDRARFVINI